MISFDRFSQSFGGDRFLKFAAADMNDDGKLDLVVSTQGSVAILFGNGDGTFQAPVNYTTPIRGANITVADFNLDGYLDVLCASTSPQQGQLRGRSRGDLITRPRVKTSSTLR